jgi:hypothetical protein
MDLFPVNQKKAEYKDKKTHPENRAPGPSFGTGILFFYGTFCFCPLPYCHSVMIRRKGAQVKAKEDTPLS